MSIVLFDATKSIKVTRPRRFGSGLLPYIPSFKSDHTVSDARWLAEQDQMARDLDAEVDAMALEAHQRDMIEYGCY